MRGQEYRLLWRRLVAQRSPAVDSVDLAVEDWARRLVVCLGYHGVEARVEDRSAKHLVALRHLGPRLWQDLVLDHMQQAAEE